MSDAPPSDDAAQQAAEPGADVVAVADAVVGTPGPFQEPPPRKLIEVGWIIVNRLDPADWDAVRQVQQGVRARLEELFPQFAWQMPVVRQEERVQENRVEPVRLLQQGTAERDSYRLDFALLVTSADLVTHYKPYAMAVVSRAVDLSVVSTSRIDPQADDFSVQRDDRIRIMADRMEVLVLHVLGHLCGLGHSDEPHNYMRDIRTVHDLATLKEFDETQVDEMARNLAEVADERLEEQKGVSRNRLLFSLRSGWINRHEVIDAIKQAKPWEFPKRLSRLTTAAISSMLILMITAETWDLALRQPVWKSVGLLSAALLITTGFIIARQRLLVRRHRRKLSEQHVVTNLSTMGIVLTGMFTTAVMLFLVTFTLGVVLFDRTLVHTWAGSTHAKITILHYVRFATFVSSLGIMVGALGASFEEQAHFRHITFVDEET